MKLSKRFWLAVLLITLSPYHLINRLYSAPWWNVYFTAGDGTIGSASALETYISDFMLKASSMCYVSNYSWSDTANNKVVLNINSLYSSGVDVKIVGDDAQGGTTNEPIHPDITGTIPMNDRTTAGSSQYMHDKVIIRDPNDSANAAVMMGSGNFNEGGWESQNNTFLFLYNQALTLNYLAEFNEMFKGTFAGGTQTTRVYTMPNGTEVRSFFGSEDQPWAATATTANGLISLLNASTESIFFEITDLYSYSGIQNPLEASCVNRAAAGVITEGVYQSIDTASTYDLTDWNDAANANVNNTGPFIRESSVTLYTKHHHKYFVIDMDWAGVGSVNASQSSAEDNPGSDENFILINDFRLAREFMKEFGRNYALTTPVGAADNTSVIEIHDWVAPAVPTVLSVTPAAASFAVSWTAPADPGNFSRYYIFISTNNTIATDKEQTTDAQGGHKNSILRPEAQVKGLASTSATLTTYNEGDALAAATDYYIGVVSVDKFGNESAALTGGPYQLSGVNNPPNNPASLQQYKSDGTTVIAVGAQTTETTVVLKGTVSDPDLNNVKLQVELRSSETAFSNSYTHESALVASGNTASVTITGLANGTTYHWQARAVDSVGAPSAAWVIFNGVDGNHFVVQTPPPLPSGGTNHIVISEIFVKTADDTALEFIELYNPTTYQIDLSGWVIDTDADTTADATIPAGKTIPANGFFLIADNGWTATKPASWPIADYETEEIGLNNTDAGVRLRSSAAGTIIDTFGYGVAASIAVGYEGTPSANDASTYVGYERYSQSAPPHDEQGGNGKDTNVNLNDFFVKTTTVSMNPQSSLSTTEPQPDTTAPTSVGLLIPANNSVDVTTTTTLTVNTASDPSAPVSYYIQLALDTGFTSGIQTRDWSTSTSWTGPAPTLANGTTYYWRVKAKDSPGNTSSYKGHILDTDGDGKFVTASAVVNNPPTAPTGGLPDDAVNWTNDPTPAFTWTFNDPDAGDSQSAYQLIVGSSDTGKITSGVSSHTPGAPGLTDGTWSWNVKTWDAADAVSPTSSNWTVKIDATDPTDVGSFGAGYNGTSSTLTWTASTDATSGVKNYKIYRGPVAITDANKSSYFLANDDAVTGYTDSTVSSGQTYYYAVTTLDNAGNESVPSVNKQVTTGSGPNPSDIVINEVFPDVAVEITDEFVELYNKGNTSVDINGWLLNTPGAGGSDPIQDITVAGIADQPGTTLQPGWYALIVDPGYTGIYNACINIDATLSKLIIVTVSGTELGDGLNNTPPDTVWISSNATGVVLSSFTYLTVTSNKSWEKVYSTGAAISRSNSANPDNWAVSTHVHGSTYCTPGFLNSVSPTPPAGDTSAPTSVGLLNPLNNAVNVSTTATLTVNTASDATTPIYYWLQIALDSAFTTGLKETGWQTSTSTSPVLANSTVYYWRVKAKDSASTPNETTYKGHTLDVNGYGTFTTAAGAVVNSSPTAPTNGSPDDAVNWTNDPTPAFTWTFNDPDAGDSQSAYQLIGSGPGSYDSGKVSSTTPSHLQPSALADGTWSWQVMCWDVADSSSPWSASWTVKIDVAAPISIADLTASLSGGSIQLNWSAPTDTSGVKNYKIWRSTESLGANPVFLATDDATPGYIDASPIYGTTNYYIVRTVDNASNESADSNIASWYIGPAGHIVISEVAVGVGSAGEEYVELYNPTDGDINLQALPSSGGILKLKMTTDSTPTNGIEAKDLTWINTIIRAHGFFLLASSPAVNGISADATYGAGLVGADGVQITNGIDAVIDMVAWGTTQVTPGDIPNCTETQRISDALDLSSGDSIERKANASSTATTLKTGGVDELEGNGYDTDNNFNDFEVHTGFLNPQNTSSQREPAIANITLTPYNVNPSTAIVTQTFTYSVQYENLASGDVAPSVARVVIDGNPFNLTKQVGDPWNNGIYTYSTTLSTGTHTYYFDFADGIGNTGRAPETSPDVFNGPAVGPELERISAYNNPTSNPLDGGTTVSISLTKYIYAYLSSGSNGWSGYNATIYYTTSTSGGSAPGTWLFTKSKTMTNDGTNPNGYDVFWVELSSGVDYRAGAYFNYYIVANDATGTNQIIDDAGDGVDADLPDGQKWVDKGENAALDNCHYFKLGTEAAADGMYEPKIVKKTEPCITSDIDSFINDFSWIPGWRFINTEVDDGGPNNLTYNNEDVGISVSLSPEGIKSNCTFYYTTDGSDPAISGTRQQFNGGATQSNNSNWNKNNHDGISDIRAFFPSDLNAAGCTIWIYAVGHDGNGGGPYTQYFKYYVGSTPGTPSGDKDDAIVSGRGNNDGRYPTTDFNNYSPLRHSQNEIIKTGNTTRYLTPGTTDEFVLGSNFLTTSGHDGITDIFYSDQVKFYLRSAYQDIDDINGTMTPNVNEAYIVWLATTTDWATAPSARLAFDSFGDDNQSPHLLKYHWLVGENTGLEGYASNPSDCTKGAPEGSTVRYVFKVRDNQSTGAFKWLYKDPTTKKQRLTDTASTAQAAGSQFEYKVLQDDITRPVAYLPLTVPGAGTITNGGVVPSTFTSPSWPTRVLGDTVTLCGSTVETVKVYVGLFDTADGRFTASGLTYGTSQWIDEPINGLYVHNTFRDPVLAANNVNYFGNDVPAVNTSTNSANSGIKGGRTDNSDSYAEGLEGYNSEGRRVTHDVLLYYVWRRCGANTGGTVDPFSWIDVDGTVNSAPSGDPTGTTIDSDTYQMIRIEKVDGAPSGAYESQVVCSSYTSNRVSMAPYNVDGDGNGIWVAEIPAPAEQYMIVGSTAATAYLYYRIWACNGDNDPQAYYNEIHGGCLKTDLYGSHGITVPYPPDPESEVENPYGKTYQDVSGTAKCKCGRVHDRDYGWVDITRYGGRVTSPPRVMIKSKVTVGGVSRTITTYLKVDPTTRRPTNIISTQVGAE